MTDYAALIDHTDLHADASAQAMARLCQEARDHGFAMVAVNSVQSALCSSLLANTGVHTGAAVAFPLGQTTIAAKVFETKDALANGADEIDYVVNLTAVKDGQWDLVKAEMVAVVDAVRERGAIVKVIFENCYLTDQEKLRLCDVASEVRPDFIKTSTGFGSGGATFHDVALMRENVDPAVKVKAAGGIRDADTFLRMVELGAERIGTSSGIAIMAELAERGLA